MVMGTLRIAIGLCLICVPVQAATINVEAAPDGLHIISIAGPLEPGDAKNFQAKAAYISKAVVEFRSEGGNLFEGVVIGEKIRQRNFATIVPDGFLCASSCALAWLGGTRRFMGPAAKIGFHAAYTTRAGQVSETGMGNALVGAYLTNLGLPYRAVIYITEAPPNAMNWLRPEDAKREGIEVQVLAARSIERPSQPGTGPEQGLQLQRRTGEFLDAWYRGVSGASNDLIAMATAYYADQVIYFGKSTSRDEVLAQVRRFAERWPDRQYKAKPDSINVKCDEPSLTCIATGLMEFDARSVARSDRSAGLASFEFALKFPTSAATPAITREGGEVLERRARSLRSGGAGLGLPWKRRDYE